MKKLFATALLLAATSTSAFAVSVDFPASQTSGEFNCTLSDPTAKVSMDTNDLDAEGFCKGNNEYVTSPGHISGVPALLVNSQYFAIQKSFGTSASIEVTADKGTITCGLGRGDGRTLWGDGQGFCAIKK